MFVCLLSNVYFCFSNNQNQKSHSSQTFELTVIIPQKCKSLIYEVNLFSDIVGGDRLILHMLHNVILFMPALINKEL